MFSLSLSKQGTYAYIGPDSHLHHGPITPRGQEAGVSCDKLCLWKAQIGRTQFFQKRNKTFLFHLIPSTIVSLPNNIWQPGRSWRSIRTVHLSGCGTSIFTVLILTIYNQIADENIQDAHTEMHATGSVHTEVATRVTQNRWHLPRQGWGCSHPSNYQHYFVNIPCASLQWLLENKIFILLILSLNYIT